ncbi:MAG: glycosyltransferase family 2 protein [Spirochaetaceae bacterium]|jgi:GT2 family glycosyltransferase|nr:glycosyltransferase family 2 protein [Spirochaetaceae bacterium]
MKCTAIVVTYNGMKWYEKCFTSLVESNFPLEIIAVDNKSTDNSVEYISNNYSTVKIIQTGTNYGFAKANNIGLKRAYENNADFYFLLNQDAWIEKDTVEKLIHFSVSNPEYGVISPVHLTGDKQHFDRGFINYFHSCSETLHAYENLFLKKDEPACYNARFVNAAAWLVTKHCLETVGGFDTILFRHYGEDSNYCHRVLWHRLKIAIITSSTICHDREHRIDKPIDITINFSVFYANILNGKKVFLKRFLIIMIKIMSVKHSKNGIKELFFLITNIHKILKSRKWNKIKGNKVLK